MKLDSIIGNGHVLHTQLGSHDLGQLKCFLYDGDETEAFQIREGLTNPLGDKPSQVLIPPDLSDKIEGSDLDILLLSQQPNPGKDERIIEPRNLQKTMLTGFKRIKNLRHTFEQIRVPGVEDSRGRVKIKGKKTFRGC